GTDIGSPLGFKPIVNPFTLSFEVADKLVICTLKSTLEFRLTEPEPDSWIAHIKFFKINMILISIFSKLFKIGERYIFYAYLPSNISTGNPPFLLTGAHYDTETFISYFAA